MAATLADLLAREFGVKTGSRINPLVASVGLAPTLIFGNNPNRLAWTIINLGVNDIFLAFDQEVSITRGILLASGGGGVNFKWNEEFDLVVNNVYGLTTIAPSEIFSIEVVTRGEVFG